MDYAEFIMFMSKGKPDSYFVNYPIPGVSSNKFGEFSTKPLEVVNQKKNPIYLKMKKV